MNFIFISALCSILYVQFLPQSWIFFVPDVVPIYVQQKVCTIFDPNILLCIGTIFDPKCLQIVRQIGCAVADVQFDRKIKYFCLTHFAHLSHPGIFIIRLHTNEISPDQPDNLIALWPMIHWDLFWVWFFKFSTLVEPEWHAGQPGEQVSLEPSAQPVSVELGQPDNNQQARLVNVGSLEVYSKQSLKSRQK